MWRAPHTSQSPCHIVWTALNASPPSNVGGNVSSWAGDVGFAKHLLNVYLCSRCRYKVSCRLDVTLRDRCPLGVDKSLDGVKWPWGIEIAARRACLSDKSPGSTKRDPSSLHSAYTLTDTDAAGAVTDEDGDDGDVMELDTDRQLMKIGQFSWL